MSPLQSLAWGCYPFFVSCAQEMQSWGLWLLASHDVPVMCEQIRDLLPGYLQGIPQYRYTAQADPEAGPSG